MTVSRSMSISTTSSKTEKLVYSFNDDSVDITFNHYEIMKPDKTNFHEIVNHMENNRRIYEKRHSFSARSFVNPIEIAASQDGSSNVYPMKILSEEATAVLTNVGISDSLKNRLSKKNLICLTDGVSTSFKIILNNNYSNNLNKLDNNDNDMGLTGVLASHKSQQSAALNKFSNGLFTRKWGFLGSDDRKYIQITAKYVNFGTPVLTSNLEISSRSN